MVGEALHTFSSSSPVPLRWHQFPKGLGFHSISRAQLWVTRDLTRTFFLVRYSFIILRHKYSYMSKEPSNLPPIRRPAPTNGTKQHRRERSTTRILIDHG